MIKTVEKSSKRLEDAIEQALKELGVDGDDANIEILSQGGIFSKAKVRVSIEVADVPSKPVPKSDTRTEPPKAQPKVDRVEEKAVKKVVKSEAKTEKKQDKKETKEYPKHKRDDKVDVPRPERRERSGGEDDSNKPSLEGDGGAKDFLDGILSRMGVEGQVNITSNGDRMTIDLVSKDGAVIGARGDTLAALRYLTSLVVNRGDNKFVYVDLDCGDYRARRAETLAKLAIKTADRAVRIGRKVRLEPMSSSDRRIIHSTLQDRTDIVCRSEGKEPRRAIAVMPVKA